jgi:hypothetical protein
MTNNTALKGACLAAGLATSWLAAPCASAQSVSVNVSITDSTPLDNAYFLYGVGTTPFYDVSMGNIASGSHSFNISVPTNGNVPNTIDPWTIVGSYATDGITYGFANPSVAVGNSYASVLGGADTETEDYNTLVSTGANSVTDFVVKAESYASSGLGTPVTLVNFSNGTEVGTATASLPEPMSASILFLGGTILISRRRRRVAG